MHLTQVHMENFKSFGRKLTVPFEAGYTGITGPNGSGKSNIGDAILFVLGPNSPRAIRAGRLTDLIFNGGEHGKPASYTIVSLEFDNRKREMPVDSDEVVLTRKVKRAPKKDDKDGYNSYFYVNGRASKKKEFVDLLQHARISADGYNITQQGDVLDICNMGDVKRRQIIDTIAGVTTFDKDIDQANKRKEEVEENLERIGIVLEEIERNLKQLDKEKGAAQRYRDLQDAIGRTKGLKAWRRKADLEDQIAQVQQQLDKYEDERKRFDDVLRDLKGQQKEAQTRFAEVEQEIRAQGGAEVEKIQDEVQQARDRMVRLEEKIAFVKEELSGGEDELLPLREELRKIEKELQNTRRVQSEAEQEHADSAAKLAEERKALDEVRELISRSDEGAMAINRELGKLKKEHEDKRIALHDARLSADRHAEKAEQVARRLSEAEVALESIQTDLKEVGFERSEIEKETGGAGKKRKETERRIFELKKAESELVQEQEDLENRIRRLDRELRDLQAQEAAAARHSGHASRAVDEILAARKDGAVKGIVGTIAELASVGDRYQTALETAAGANIHAIVVEDDGVAAQCIELLKRSKAGRAKLLPLNKMVPGRPRGQALMKVKKDGCLGFALDLIDFDKRYHAAFWNVFGDTLVVDSMDTGRRLMGGVRMVSLDGELFEAGGAMIGGAAGKKQKSGFTNADRGRIDGLLRDIAEAEQHQDQALGRIAGIRKELVGLQDELETHGRSGVGAEERLKNLEGRKKELARKAENLQKDVAALQGEQDDVSAKTEELRATVEDLEGRLEELEHQREEKGQLLLKGSKKELRDKVEASDRAVRELQDKALQAENRRLVAAKQADLVEERRKELADRIAGFGTGREDLEKQLQMHQEAHKKAQAEVKALNEMERKATKQLGGLRDKKDRIYEELTDLKVKIEKTQDRIETHHSMAINAKSKLPSLEETLGEALVELKEHPVEVDAEDDVPPFDELRRTLRDLENKLDRLGPVNMRALEEYEAQAQRKGDLDAEVDRLKEQRQELIRLVEEVTERKKGVFMEVYAAINENFAEVYADLSLGGKALMELEDQDDPFAGGLILKAQPMGKRVTRLNALSGGEKSLTSMAFIFAIQRYDPSPFYYFDEVDQNLDAVNSELLAKMIRKNAQFAQFIQVSLRKITLKEASHLYGVTQQVAGQSEVIANFDLEQVQEDPDDEDGASGDGDGATGPADGSDGGSNGKGLREEIESIIDVRATP